MLKRVLFSLFAFMLALSAFCQEQATVEVLGKKKGTVNIIREHGEIYTEALALAKILKMQTSWFGKSGQLNIKNGKGYFAVLREGRFTVVANGKEEALSNPVLLKDGVLYAPMSFFTKGSISPASGFAVEYSAGKITIERFYTIERLRVDNTVSSSKVVFMQKGKVERKVSPKGPGRVDISFPGAVIKREETVNIKNDFIDKVRIGQDSEGVKMAFILKGKAKHWDIYNEENSVFVFAAAEDKIAKPVIKAPARKEGSPAPTPVVEEALVLKPSVLGEEILLGEEFFNPEPPAPKLTVKSAPPKTVIKPLQTSATPRIEASKKPNKKNRKARIVIDPGHGGKDPGAVRRGSAKEKEINLIIAKYLYELLKKEKDFDVKLTRSDDSFIPLGRRAKISNDYKADLFISIHANAAKRVSANGFEVYFRSDKASSAEAAETAALENEALQYEGQSGASVSFADLLLKSLANNEHMNESSKVASHIRRAVNKNRGAIGIQVYQNSCIKQANFYVLKGVDAPSLLIELGYLSNANDRKRLNTKAARAKLTESIRDGIVSYAKAEGWK